MQRIAVLDANAYIDLEGADHPDAVLAELSRFALEGKLSLYLTPELPLELERDRNVDRRDRQTAHTRKFPEVPLSHEGTVASIAVELAYLLFPSDTGERDPRRRSDCRQLAYAVEFEADFFVTRDKHILRRKIEIKELFGVRIVSPEEIVAKIKIREALVPARLDLSGPRLLVTVARREHSGDIQGLLKDLDQDYPGFLSHWLPARLKDDTFIKKVEIVDDQLAAVSISKDKGDDVVKLSTFYIDPDYRALGLGQHFMHHELINWANRGVWKVVVTFPARKQDMLPFFRRYGFWVEGVSPLRYGMRAEVVMGKYFLHEVVVSPDWPSFVARLLKDILLCAQQTSAGNAVWLPPAASRDMVFPVTIRPYLVEDQFSEAGARISVTDHSTGEIMREWDTYALEAEFFPLLLHFPERTAALIPIKPRWAELLFEFEREQQTLFESHERVRLRSDNVYYRRGTDHGRIRRGTPLVFYISGDEGKVAAVAKARTVELGPPEVVYAKFGPLGVLSREEVQDAAGDRGTVQAIRFDYLEPLPVPVTLDRLRRIVPDVNLQTTSAISFETYLRIRSEGGLPHGRPLRPDVN